MKKHYLRLAFPLTIIVLMVFSLTFQVTAAPSSASGAWVVQTYVQGPADNPLKGFMPWQGNYTNFPHSMEFNSFAWSDVQTDVNTFNWTVIDNFLDDVASRGHQGVFRFYADYPNRAYAVPGFLSAVPKNSYTDYGNGSTATSYSPDYDDPALIQAMTNFIAALGARYDGDARVAFVQVGLIGFWGEWHTYRDVCSCDTWMPSPATQNTLLEAFDTAFSTTKVLLRSPRGNSPNLNLGYHDDSFNYTTYDNATDWFFWSQMLATGAENKWRTESMGGELRPEIQLTTWQNPNLCVTGSMNIEQCFNTSVDTTHASWQLAQALFNPGNTGWEHDRAVGAAKRLGYDLFVSQVALPNTASSGNVQVDIKLQNKGVAPFPYKWPVQLGVADMSNQVVAVWDTTWDLRSAIDQGVDVPYSFTKVGHGLPAGSYKLLMRAVNPLANGKPLVFANQKWGQDVSNWLTLDMFIVVGKAIFHSVGAEDGFIIESNENSNTGGSMYSAANTFRLGDDAANRQYRAILSFATSSLPDNAIIQSAVLKIKQTGIPTGTNPFSVLGSLQADIRQGSFGSSALQLTDFNSPASASAIGVFNSTPVNTYYTLTLNATGRSFINRAGRTQFRLRFNKDDNNNHSADYLRFLSGNIESGKPRLFIDYVLPTSPTATPTQTHTATATPTITNTPTITPTPIPGHLVVDNYDGNPPGWSSNGRSNDLGKWTGANGFVNGLGGAGIESDGELTLQYANSGWFGSDITQDISNKTDLVFVIKGAAGGEEDDFHLILGGVDKTFAAFSGDTITTDYKTIHINLAAHGVNQATPGQLQMNFWWGSSGAITIDEIRFEGVGSGGATATPTQTPSPTTTVINPSLGLDNYDGNPAGWSASGRANDLGNWTGANGFANGGDGSGVESGGELTLQYSNSGWFASDVTQDISDKTELVFVIKGAVGGEEDDFHLSIGGVEKTFAAFSGDTITTGYKTIRISLAANGVNLVLPGQLNMTFWWGSSGEITIDEIRFE